MKLTTLLTTGMIFGISAALADSDDLFIKNGNFNEAGKNWELSYREPELGTATFETDDAPAGAGFARLAPLNSASQHYLSLQQKLDAPPPVGKYKLKAWLRISDDYAARMPRVSIGWRLAGDDGESGSASVTLDQNATPGEWILCEEDVEIPENVESAYIFLFTHGSMGHADFDGISLEPLP